MKKFLISIILGLYFPALLLGTSNQNVILVNIEGVSRSTLYALIQKNRLPAINEIINKGNYRNLSINGDLNIEKTYTNYYTNDPNNQKASLFYRLKKSYPNADSCIILSPLTNVEEQAISTNHLHTLLTNHEKWISKKYPLIQRTTKDTEEIALTELKKLKPPFFLSLNFTEPDHIAKRYREGTSYYSQTIQKCDQSILKMIATLKERGLWENSNILITASHGYKKRSKEKSNDSWIISSKKVLIKGTEEDILPTILHWFKINPYGNKPIVKARILTQ